MRFTVIWTQSALDSLADLWNHSLNRNAITVAQHIIDQLLKNDPYEKGVDFYGDRLLVVPPLQVIFSLNDLDMQVVIHTVW
jgi:plasmid stabilization system protein ParE